MTDENDSIILVGIGAGMLALGAYVMRARARTNASTDESDHLPVRKEPALVRDDNEPHDRTQDLNDGDPGVEIVDHTLTTAPVVALGLAADAATAVGTAKAVAAKRAAKKEAEGAVKVAAKTAVKKEADGAVKVAASGQATRIARESAEARAKPASAAPAHKSAKKAASRPAQEKAKATAPARTARKPAKSRAAAAAKSAADHAAKVAVKKSTQQAAKVGAAAAARAAVGAVPVVGWAVTAADVAMRSWDGDTVSVKNIGKSYAEDVKALKTYGESLVKDPGVTLTATRDAFHEMEIASAETVGSAFGEKGKEAARSAASFAQEVRKRGSVGGYVVDTVASGLVDVGKTAVEKVTSLVPKHVSIGGFRLW